MFTNRVSAYFDDVESGLLTENELSNPPEVDAPPAPPKGFTSLPSTLLPAMADAQQIYRAAYEQAKKDALQRLLELLRSRANS